MVLLIVPELEWTQKSLKHGYSTTPFAASQGHDCCLVAQGQWQVNSSQTNMYFPTGSGLWWEANDRELMKQTNKNKRKQQKRGKKPQQQTTVLQKSPFGSLRSNSGDDCSQQLGRICQSEHPYNPRSWDREKDSGIRGQPGLQDTVLKRKMGLERPP